MEGVVIERFRDEGRDGELAGGAVRGSDGRVYTWSPGDVFRDGTFGERLAVGATIHFTPRADGSCTRVSYRYVNLEG